MNLSEQRQRLIIRTALLSILFLILGIQLYHVDLAQYSLVTDRTFYKDVLFGFTDKAFTEGFDAYYLKKGLPFALINIVYSFLGIAKTEHSFLVLLFTINIVSLLLMIYFYFSISKRLKLNISAEIIGFVIVFYSVHILKAFVMCPVGSDYIGYMMSFLLFWLYLKRKTNTIVVLSFFCAFIDPLLMLIGILLSLFPQKEVFIYHNIMDISFWKRILLIFVRTFVVVSIIPFLILLTYFKAPSFSVNGLASLFSGDWYDHCYTNFTVLTLSVLSVMWVLYKMLQPLRIDIVNSLKDLISSFRIKDILCIAVLYICVFAITSLISNGEHAWDTPGLAKQAVMASVSFPFEIFEAQFRYHGFFVLLIIFFWSKLLPLYASKGYGYLGVICIGLVFIMYPEARYTIDVLPFYLFPVLVVIREYQFKKIALLGIVVFSLVYSRFWMPDSWDTRFWNGTAPYQYLDVYILFMVVAVICSMILYCGYKRSWFTIK